MFIHGLGPGLSTNKAVDSQDGSGSESPWEERRGGGGNFANLSLSSAAAALWSPLGAAARGEECNAFMHSDAAEGGETDGRSGAAGGGGARRRSLFCPTLPFPSLPFPLSISVVQKLAEVCERPADRRTDSGYVRATDSRTTDVCVSLAGVAAAAAARVLHFVRPRVRQTDDGPDPPSLSPARSTANASLQNPPPTDRRSRLFACRSVFAELASPFARYSTADMDGPGVVV